MHINVKLFVVVTLGGSFCLTVICLIMSRKSTVWRPQLETQSVNVGSTRENNFALRHIPGLYKTQSDHLERLCSDINGSVVSETRPSFYPLQGTGTSANLSGDVFDTSHFREFCYKTMVAVVVVYSATANFERRKATRDTIGKQCELYGCKVVFIVGTSTDSQTMETLHWEYARYEDIYVMNKIDQYKHLNDKAVAMLDWILVFCRQPKFVIHHGDDVFSNIRLFLGGMSSVSDTKRFIYGRVWKRVRPQREPQNKYFVSTDQYPYDEYPDFVNGISYGFPTSLARELRCAVHKARYVWLEDVWLCGEVASYLGIKLVDSKFRSWHDESFKNLRLSEVTNLLFIHFAMPADLYRFNASLHA